eukprot:858018-Rhodomonas_salina.4
MSSTCNIGTRPHRTTNSAHNRVGFARPSAHALTACRCSGMTMWESGNSAIAKSARRHLAMKNPPPYTSSRS